MVTLLLDSDRLEVALSPAERVLSRRRGNISVPRARIAKVMLTEDAWIWLRGVPSPGTAVPGIVAMGCWKSGNSVDFAVVRGRRPSVVIDLEGHDEFDRLVLTTRHGVQLIQALRLDAADEAADVADIAPPARPAKRPRTRPARTAPAT
ncbi:hypothetical protein RYJ27_01250 [Microbacterium limosum]|uniref:Uncharacterized protein n=1 Tax=Microbacterium limosum TaxID=3079935 RepID=A0AAU0MI25_9MICO|nr:hypothetical protein [Microbacterium sp. Y20]WOQ69898.1 hypothetical protein RYJ27_01250 [Microbacterium sp. Y20]